MMRDDATNLAYSLLHQCGLKDWKVRLTTNLHYLGKCVHQHKVIYLNTHQIDTHPDVEIDHTIRHEIAHALTQGHGHDEVWAEKARELGCSNTQLCGPPLDPIAIDAIRSGHVVEVDYIEEVIRKPRYRVTQLKDHCPICGKVAKEKSVTIKGTTKITFLECGHLTFKEIPKQTPFEELISTNGDKDCKHEWNANRCLHCEANRLFDFQIVGARSIEENFGRKGVFDEQGLGKTVQALAYLKYHPECFPVLFIVKSGIKYQWLTEIFKWLGDSYFSQVINSSKEHPIKGFKTYIVSYDMLRRYDTKLIKELGIKTIVIDECQQIKNPDSSRTVEVRNLVRDVQYFIALSGTPWKNRGSEYFPVLNMLDATRFNSYAAFVNRWVDIYYDGAKPKQGGIRDIKAFREFTKDIVIRRERKDVELEFPDKNRVKFTTELDETTREIYDQEVSDFVKWWNQLVLDGREGNAFNPNQMDDGGNAIARLQRMRHMLGLSKIPTTIDIAEEFIENTDRKLVIFVHHKDVGNIIEKKLLESDVIRRERIPIMRLTADMNGSERFATQQKFNELSRTIMIASTLASGEGLNLQTCSDAIMHERQWNPGNEEQAEDRFVRIGSTANKANFTYVHAEDSIDTKLDSIIERKRIDYHNSMNKGVMIQWNQESVLKELVNSMVSDFRKRKAG